MILIRRFASRTQGLWLLRLIRVILLTLHCSLMLTMLGPAYTNNMLFKLLLPLAPALQALLIPPAHPTSPLSSLMDTRPVTSPTTGSNSESDVQNSSGNNPQVSFYQLTTKDSRENCRLCEWCVWGELILFNGRIDFASFALRLGLRVGHSYLDLDFASVNLGGSTMCHLTSGTFLTTWWVGSHWMIVKCLTGYSI